MFTSWEWQQTAPTHTVMAFIDAAYLTAGARTYLHLSSAPASGGAGSA